MLRLSVALNVTLILVLGFVLYRQHASAVFIDSHVVMRTCERDKWAHITTYGSDGEPAWADTLPSVSVYEGDGPNIIGNATMDRLRETGQYGICFDWLPNLWKPNSRAIAYAEATINATDNKVVLARFEDGKMIDTLHHDHR